MKGLGRAAMPPPTIAHKQGKKTIRKRGDDEIDDEMETRNEDEMVIERVKS